MFENYSRLEEADKNAEKKQKRIREMQQNAQIDMKQGSEFGDFKVFYENNLHNQTKLVEK